VATSGLQAASTRPLPMDKINPPINNDTNPVAKIMASTPTEWQINASLSSNFIPSTSHNGPKMKMVMAKPHNAAPPIQPTSAFVRTKYSLSGPIIAPIIANVTEVAMRAKLLPQKSRSTFTFSGFFVRASSELVGMV